MQGIIKKPVITEKATAASEKRNAFSFEGAKQANSPKLG